MKLEKFALLYRFLFTISLCFCIASTGEAQNGNSYTPAIPTIIPPSPISQTYQRFMGFQPELSTGAVNVTIPLHTISYDNFTLPFNLNYQSNGIKCGDSSYPLGYGWALYPGLRITRTIQGNADELAPKKYHYDSLESYDCFFKRLGMPGSGEDSMYDVFTLSLPQGQAHFIVEQTVAWSGKWEVITASVPYKIEPLQYSGNNKLFRGFKVTDENGLVYYFGEDSEGATTDRYIERSQVAGSLLPTTYLLRKVELPGGNQQEVTFEWNTNNLQAVQTISYQTSIDGYGEKSGSEGYHSDIPEGIYHEYIEGKQIVGSALKKITLPNAVVNFSYNNKGLYFMSIVNKNNVIVKAINFEIKDNLLEYIKINDDEKYGFHYNDKRFGSIYEQDFWGYYNGAGSKNTYYTHPSYTYQILQYNSLRFLTGADRKPNNAYVDANILEQVDYPTGGYTRFEYEPHRYFWNHKIQTGGGLRVKRTITTTNAMYGDDKPIIRDYKYGMNECGYGKCSIEPNEETFASELFCRYQSGLSDYSYRQTTVHPNSLYAGYLLFNLPIWYNDVTEYITDNGRVCYKYDYEPDALAPYKNENINDFLIDYPNKKLFYERGISLQASWQYEHIFDRAPRLIKKQIYDARGIETYREECIYCPAEEYPGKSLQNINYTMIFKNISNSDVCYPNAVYDFLISPISPKTYFLDSKIIMEDGVTTRTNYQYNHTKSYNRIEIIHSDSTIVLEKYLYADDDLSGLPVSCETSQSVLRNGHRNILPICISRSVNGEITERKIIQYRDLWGKSMNYVYPIEEYFQMGDGDFEKRVEYSRYNKAGKPVEVRMDDQSIVYLWGYHSQYPIAKIENCTYNEVLAIIDQNSLEEIAAAIAPDDGQWEKVNFLRKQLPDAIVSTFTYQPLVGMLSETAPSGITTYYKYDKAGRLTEKYRIDKQSGDKEYLENYEYKY